MFVRLLHKTTIAAIAARVGQRRFPVSPTIVIKARIDNWLKANRQWRSEHNKQHARYQWEHAELPETAMFWQLILERLEG